MPKVKILNENIYPLKTVFKGEDVLIGSKDYWRDKKGDILEMDIYEASDFKGQYHAIFSDASGQQDPKSFKMIKLEPVGIAQKQEVEDVPSYICMQCKHASPSEEELEAHVNVRHKYAARLSMPEVDAEIAPPKRKPGRPPMEKHTA